LKRWEKVAVVDASGDIIKGKPSIEIERFVSDFKINR